MLQFRRVSLTLLLCLFAVLPQGTTSRLTGVVNDPSGSAVAGATVKLKNQATEQIFTTITSGAGTYAFEAVQPGVYTVNVESAGFNAFAATGNQVAIGQPTTVNVTLQVGQVSNKIEVSGAAEVVQTSTSGNFGNLLVEQQIRDLPIVGTRGRNPLQLVDLQPGVVDTQSITGGGVHVFGSRDRAWNFTLDGIDNNESSTGGSNFAPIRTNPDSLAEFRVITSNPTAEYGRSSGAQVALITRSGSNDFHGTGFEFYRTPRLNANEWQNNFNGLAKPQFVQHVFGGDLGGPIVKNRTFFFVNVQALTALNTNVTTRTVYTAQARQGILRYVNGGRNGAAGSSAPSVDANGNVLPGLNVQSYNVAANDPARLGLDNTILSTVNAAPLPTRFDLGDGLNTAGYVFSAGQQERQHDIVFKIDQIINEHNTFYARGAFGEQDTNCDA
ncbi:MAG: carboxypeptidase-like regulatory domain-containing protein, partial [Acidobacteriota bacterium]|nr:carboxypeptidase-like regulatory domain-containing protein [Acidobacteriota bacterium]